MRKILFSLILVMLLCSSCETKKIALERSAMMINDIYTNIDNEKIIDKYLYRPDPDVIYCMFEQDGIEEMENSVWFEESLKEYTRYRQSVGKLIEYSILENEYDFELLPLYDYGYPHGIYIKLKCIYENTITEEAFYGYYIKERDKCAIACFYVKVIQ